MLIGVPKEIKNNEFRVGLTPSGTEVLTAAGHKVLVERRAGEGSGFTDDEYEAAGAELYEQAADIWNRSEMIVKVKEPLPEETRFFREGLLLFTYLHLAAAGDLASKLVQAKVDAVAYETVRLADGSLPLLTPMSEVAGRMSVQIGARLLEAEHGGRGVLLGGVPGVLPAQVAILGGGTVGTHAAKMAAGLGADVILIDKSAERLRALDDLFGGRVKTLMSEPANIAYAACAADLLIGAVLVPGARAPRLVPEAVVRRMKPGSVIVDVAIDQGGSIETIDRITTHSDPVYIRHGVLHYAVANMPGAVPRTSTLALTQATLPYVLRLAELGLKRAAALDEALAEGVNCFGGAMVHPAAAAATGLDWKPLSELLAP